VTAICEIPNPHISAAFEPTLLAVPALESEFEVEVELGAAPKLIVRGTSPFLLAEEAERGNCVSTFL